MCNRFMKNFARLSSVMVCVAICSFAFSLTANAQVRSYYDNLSFSQPDEILKLDSAVYQSLPGVYRVHTSGICRIECPISINIDTSRLKSETSSFRQKYSIDASVDDAYVRWLQVAKQPDLYLKPSASMGAFETTEKELGTGSCYAVDRTGILLTNRHVVSSDPRRPMDFQQLMGCEPPPLIELIRSLVKDLGNWTGKGIDDEFVQTNLLSWFASHSIWSTQVTEIKIAVAYSSKNWFEQRSESSPTAITARLFGIEVREPKYIPATILAMGDERHANDIAILKLNGIVDDALICLNLARPEEVREGARVYTLGFPGYRYDFENLALRDMMSVTLQGGEVVRTPKKVALNLAERLKVRTLGIQDAEDLLFVSAYMNFGSSGGPVILADGSVAGMTVCGAHLPAEERATEQLSADSNAVSSPILQNISGGDVPNRSLKDAVRAQIHELIKHSYDQNLAIPLENIVAFLQQHGIKPDPGDLTKDWHEAVSLYRSGKHAEAANKLESIANRQFYFASPAKPFELKPVSITSHYVAELRDAALYKAKR